MPQNLFRVEPEEYADTFKAMLDSPALIFKC